MLPLAGNPVSPSVTRAGGPCAVDIKVKGSETDSLYLKDSLRLDVIESELPELYPFDGAKDLDPEVTRLYN